MKTKQETIYALSTPPGKSAIAVVRISGERSYNCLKNISLNMPTKPNKATTNKIVDEQGDTIDKTVTTYFKKPKSYTGEDMVEVSLHGGPAVIEKFIKTLLINKNIRQAEPGEFTRRSFENNKLDLTQVEAVADIVNAETEAQRIQAHNQLAGIFSKKTKEIYKKTKKLLANIESLIDFTDEDLPKNLVNRIKEQNKNIITSIDKVLETGNVGKKIRTGFSVGIIGKTNVGKSSFINSISNQNIAIVTKIPGTTTDVIESFVDIDGIPVKFYDTAGIRKPKRMIEKIGIKKSILISKKSDLNIVFIEKSSEIKDYSRLNRVIFVQSKYDIRKKPIKSKEILNISSKTKHGFKKLIKTISKELVNKQHPENFYISRERHRLCFISAKKHLSKKLSMQQLDIYAEDIRLALKEISKIYGRVDIEEILDIVFKEFCIGK